MMIESTIDILILAGALALVVLAVVMAMVGRQLYRVLKNLGEIVERVNDITGRIERWIFAPIDFIQKHLGEFKVVKKLIAKLTK